MNFTLETSFLLWCCKEAAFVCSLTFDRDDGYTPVRKNMGPSFRMDRLSALYWFNFVWRQLVVAVSKRRRAQNAHLRFMSSDEIVQDNLRGDVGCNAAIDAKQRQRLSIRTYRSCHVEVRNGGDLRQAIYAVLDGIAA